MREGGTSWVGWCVEGGTLGGRGYVRGNAGGGGGVDTFGDERVRSSFAESCRN